MLPSELLWLTFQNIAVANVDLTSGPFLYDLDPNCVANVHKGSSVSRVHSKQCASSHQPDNLGKNSALKRFLRAIKNSFHLILYQDSTLY